MLSTLLRFASYAGLGLMLSVLVAGCIVEPMDGDVGEASDALSVTCASPLNGSNYILDSFQYAGSCGGIHEDSNVGTPPYGNSTCSWRYGVSYTSLDQDWYLGYHKAYAQFKDPVSQTNCPLAQIDGTVFARRISDSTWHNVGEIQQKGSWSGGQCIMVTQPGFNGEVYVDADVYNRMDILASATFFTTRQPVKISIATTDPC